MQMKKILKYLNHLSTKFIHGGIPINIISVYLTLLKFTLKLALGYNQIEIMLFLMYSMHFIMHKIVSHEEKMAENNSVEIQIVKVFLR